MKDYFYETKTKNPVIYSTISNPFYPLIAIHLKSHKILKTILCFYRSLIKFNYPSKNLMTLISHL